MHKRKAPALLLLSLVCFSQLLADDQFCSSTHEINRVSIRHIESKGIGYNQGYTTLEAFFAPLPSLTTRWVPFLDLRGHIFNDGKPAANGGLGLRYIDSRVWGGNVYYDYRKTSHHRYNQVSFGLESLGRYLDYRVNGYFPLGRHKGSFGDASFDSFSGNSIYVARKQELGLKGGNAEVGIHIAQVKGIDFYSALGPYYFGNDTKHTFGGEFRIAMDVKNIFRIEGNTSYDHLFGWIGQGQISLSYAFTPKTMSRKHKKGSCSFHGFVRERAFQRVDKQEIVVVTTQKKKSVAINPATGLPYVVWFVDNTSHSLGTYESPFNTLADAENASGPNDIIAVLPGDGTDTGMSSGITLQDGQKLWGMGAVHALQTTLGTINIKPLASQMPVLSNTNGSDAVIIVANSNDIAGLKIMDTKGKNGIQALNKIGNYNIENNVITVFNGDQNHAGILFTTSTVNAFVTNNTLISGDNSQTSGIGAVACSGNFTINDNLLSGADENSGFFLGIVMNYNGSLLKGIIQNNTLIFNPIAQNAAIGIRIGAVSSAINSELLIANNQINNIYFGTQKLLNAGIGIQLQGAIFPTLRNNRVTTLDNIKMPSYKFVNLGQAPISQINFAPDNIGNSTYSGF